MIALALALAWIHDGDVTASRIDVERYAVVVTFAGDAPPMRIWSDGEELKPESAGRVVRYASSKSLGSLRFRMELAKSHRHVADLPDGRTLLFDERCAEREWSATSSRFSSFLALGVEHILTGWDHLVFLLALLVISTSFGQVGKVVTAFTLAHSATLGLTVLGVIAPPSWLVESAIAASIVYVAVENWFVKEARHRWLLVVVFGLIHGMGFGGSLLEMHIAQPAVALAGFNLGVEFGQLSVVAIAWPLLVLARRKERFHRIVVVRGLSGAAAALGVAWLIQRIA